MQTLLSEGVWDKVGAGLILLLFYPLSEAIVKVFLTWKDQV